MTYSLKLTQALNQGVDSPERFLAIAIIARWADDLGTRKASLIDESWADLAGVPVDWLKRLDPNLGALDKTPRMVSRG